MRAKLQFPIYCLFWAAAVFMLVLSVSPLYGPPSAAICLGLMMLFWWVRCEPDEVFMLLHPFMVAMMFLSIVLCAFTASNVATLYVVGPTFLGYLYMEGGYRYEYPAGTDT